MGWRKELKVFIRDVRVFIQEDRTKAKEVGTVLALYREIIKRQNEQINDFHRKLLARDLPELVNFTIPEGVYKYPDYNPLNDEDNAGEVVTIPDPEQSIEN